MEEIIKFETPAEWCAQIGVKCCHPHVAVFDYHNAENFSLPSRFCFGFFSILLHKGEKPFKVRYGCRTYEYYDGSLAFTSPKQVLSFSDSSEVLRPDKGCYSLIFHPDYIRNTHVTRLITDYKFFSYEVNEALKVSESEAEDIIYCFKCAENELRLYGEAHSPEVVCGAIGLMLSWCHRFYDRQYESKRRNHDILSRFEALLNDYYAPGFSREGLPTVSYFAEMLHLSPDYMSSLLRKETGHNAQEYLHYHLIETAKIRLCSTTQSVSQIAYELGFEYPQYFSRLFKRKTGISPKEYREQAGKGKGKGK